MIIEDFKVLAEKRFDHCLKLMVGQKHKEYSRGGDKLHNFKRAGQLLICSPERALIGMFIKHFVSLLDIVDDLDKGELPKPEILGEKIGDGINYFPLLEALIIERIRESGKGFE